MGSPITCGSSTRRMTRTLACNAKQLLESCLRMKPIGFFSPSSGEEAFDYLRNVNSGHPGSITSIHARAPTRLRAARAPGQAEPAGQELARRTSSISCTS